ncbi:MAG TPA: HAD hydrolase family protein [Vicinamibacteria bacterium]
MSVWDAVPMNTVARPVHPSPVTTRPLDTLPAAPLEAESRFYGAYAWCLDAFPTVGDLAHRLGRELSRLEDELESWQRQEVATNVFMLSSAIADAVDDYLGGESYDLSRAALLPGTRPLLGIVERVLAAGHRYRARGRGALRAWRAAWGSALVEFLQMWLGSDRADPAALASGGTALAGLLERELPEALRCRRAKVPAAFRTQDLTHHDVVELAGRFASAFPDRERPVLVVGLRTAGSYFAPLVRASLLLRGYREVEAVTLRPKKGGAPWEQAALARCAARRGLAVVVDEPANTGATIGLTIGLLRRAGVPLDDVVVLLPVHPTRRDWRDGHESLPLTRTTVLTLEPEDWHKHRLLEPKPVERQMQEYFWARGYAEARVGSGRDAEGFNQRLERLSEEKFHSRLKRVYEVRLRDQEGGLETRYVLAKSVGWGWLGYHAFLAAERLAEFVPPVLGLRDGVLFLEWLPEGDVPSLPRDRAQLLSRAAAYVAARVKALRLPTDPLPELDAQQQKGHALLAAALSGAFGSKPAAVLRRARLCRELARRACPVPTLIDGKMRLLEWVRGPASFLKTDFEHHGMGKTELNVTDPAYDLAEAVMHLGLSAAEESMLLRRYREDSGDQDVEQRLFPYKLLAGTAALKAALDNLRDPRLRHRHQEFNRSYIEAADFLTVHTVRFCARRCRRPDAAAWRSPLVVLDVDGVLDKQIFGFPSTTAAGIEALSLLHTHGVAVALNSARTLREVQEYSRSYGCAGGVAEYGSVAWDGVTDRTQVLVTEESREQMQRLERALRRIPGVFLNERYRHSLRAYSYEGGRTVPLPRGLVEGTIVDLGLDRLTLHQTYVDSTVLAREVDKGKGLLALLALAGMQDAETVAIGDSEPDLAMFRVASRSFAPRHMSAKATARLLGCRITDRTYQPGLLSAVRSIIHPRAERCARCESCACPEADGLFWELLKAADRRPLDSLARTLADPMSLEAFRR